MTDISDKKCAPDKKYENGSCFKYNSLVKIANAWNEKYDTKIKITSDKKNLVSKIEDKLEDKCSDQTCWLRQKFIHQIADEKMKDTFRPKGPDSKKEWLSTLDINAVMEQYQNKYKDFIYLGTTPSDFLELPVLGISNLDFNDLIKKNKYQIGMVINLDEHNESGSHWVSLYANLKKNQVYFFDSFGKKPIKNIKKFLNKIIQFLYKKEFDSNIPIKYLEKAFEKYHKLSKPLQKALSKVDIRYNKERHQRTTYECGVYSMNFILRLLDGDSFDDIISNPLSDKKMNECRNVYFRNKYN